MSTEKISDIVKKLIAKAQSAKECGNLEEADAFAAKANALLLKHNLDRAKLMAEMSAEDDKFAGWVWSEKIYYPENLAGDRWRKDLIKVLCRFNLCGHLLSGKHEKDKYLQVYGLMENVETVVFLYNFLQGLFLDMAKDDRARLTKEEREEVCRHTYLKDWLMGANEGLYRKLKDGQEKSEYSQAIGQLIIYNDKALDKFLHQEKPGFTLNKPRHIQIAKPDAFERGFETGRNTELNGRRLSNAEETAAKKLLTDKNNK